MWKRLGEAAFGCALWMGLVGCETTTASRSDGESRARRGKLYVKIDHTRNGWLKEAEEIDQGFQSWNWKSGVFEQVVPQTPTTIGPDDVLVDLRIELVEPGMFVGYINPLFGDKKLGVSYRLITSDSSTDSLNLKQSSRAGPGLPPTQNPNKRIAEIIGVKAANFR